ncbi:hypothetical protein pmac_cds_526 [Pandoravirus macleodensis]|uniref:Uncharacterized protein n=1 Tax=Pandoravirus macleodensis TaxID=2107707 RepID=A0A2U7UFI4_9VIRU|nr:hypothetical protein pmac_cds_526 [Pandoravirus macleodensis]AVK77214.1 hypothetical protein pmac_cds_526 [Pandoravirus macleodensis]
MGASIDSIVPCAGRLPQYEELLPVELQCAIMARLIEIDPKSALCLYATSRQQAAVLESQRAQLAAINPLLVAVDGVTPSAVDYLRVRIAMGIEDPQGCAILWLLESFVRFLFSEPEWSADRRIRGADAHRIIKAITDDLAHHGPRAAARAWHQWLTVKSTDIVYGREIDGLFIDSMFAKHTGRYIDGRTATSGDIDLFYLRRIGIQLGGDVAPAAPDTTLTALSFGPRYQNMTYERLCKQVLGDVTPAQLKAWTQNQQALDVDTSRRIARGLSSDSYDRMAQFIDRGVRQNATDAYACLLRAGRLRIVDFTGVFRPRLYIMPSNSTISVCIDIAPRRRGVLFIRR